MAVPAKSDHDRSPAGHVDLAVAGVPRSDAWRVDSKEPLRAMLPNEQQEKIAWRKAFDFTHFLSSPAAPTLASVSGFWAV